MATSSKTPAKNDVDEIEAFFQRRALNTAPAWRPEPGAVMAATVVGLRMGADNGYGAYPVIIYKTDSGEFFSVHAFHTLLRNRLKELDTKIGKRQILSYMGKQRKNKATQEEIDKGLADYHNYYVENAGENDSTGVDENFEF